MKCQGTVPEALIHESYFFDCAFDLMEECPEEHKAIS